MHVLRLEWIGHNVHQQSVQYAKLLDALGGGGELVRLDSRRPWVLRLTGVDDSWTVTTERVNGRLDYRNANSRGSRGVEMVYTLPDGVYCVHELISWRNSRQYFLLVSDSNAAELTKEEAICAVT